MKEVLLVDDSTTILLSVGEMLGNLKLSVTTAKDGDEALNLLRNGLKPALIITDYNMPNMNGIELIKAAKQISALRFTPMIILTTESQADRREAGKAAGATAWIVKPVAFEALTQVVKKIIPGM